MSVRRVFADFREALHHALGHFGPHTAPASAAPAAAVPEASLPEVDCSLRPEWLLPDLDFPVPDWRHVWDWIQGFPEEQRHALWCNVARHWATRIAKAFGGGGNVYETANVFAVLPGDIDRGKRAARFYEELLGRLRTTLGDMALPKWYGKFTVFVAPERDTYFRYHAIYTRPGEHKQSGGFYVNRGYGHVVLPSPESMFDTRVLAHELCHALLCHHTLPLWLNEGVTQTTETAIAGRTVSADHETTLKDHRAFWTPDNIGLFWSGEGFNTPGDTSTLSYNLAYLVVRAFLSVDRRAMAEVVRQARPDDAGFAAFQAVYGQTPVDLLTELFGAGDWERGHQRPDAPDGPAPEHRQDRRLGFGGDVHRV